MSLNPSLYSSDEMSWETPSTLFNKLNDEFNFTLDPCCVKETAKCPLYYTPEIDGLKQPWFGSVFMNPPYGRTIKLWMAKAAHESSLRKSLVCCLVPVRSDSKWWHHYAMKSSEIRLLNRRLTFEGGNNKAPFPAALVIFNGVCRTPKLVSYEI
jgi:phage N-6-adenine-methyltransferase